MYLLKNLNQKSHGVRNAGVLGLCAILMAPLSAFAMPIGSALEGQIDFRDMEYGDCYGMSTCSINGLELTAVNQDGAADIYWDSRDGLGILGAEDDEIDGTNGEFLTVNFDSPTALLGVWFTDLFNGGGDPLEQASTIVVLSDGTSVEFMTDGADPFNGGNSNGEIFQSFGGSLDVTSIMFGTPVLDNSDHSVAGIIRAAGLPPVVGVPDPSLLALLGLALFGLGLRARKA